MNKIETYEVTFTKNSVYQTNLVETARTPEEIRDWYLNTHGAFIVISIKPFAGVPKPGQPIVRI